MKAAARKEVIRLQATNMTGEDVSCFHQKVPGVHWQLGNADSEKGFSHPLHSLFFDFNEQVMPLGAAFNAQRAVDYLVNKGHEPLAWPLDQY